MTVCVIYSSPKLGDVFLQLPIVNSISKHHNSKIILCINKAINLDNIFSDSLYVNDIFYNSFRRGKNFINDILELKNNLIKKNISTVYLIEKTKGSIIASKLARVKFVYSYGIGIEKYFLENNNYLNRNDLRYNYTIQGKKFLKKLNINYDYNQKLVEIKKENLLEIKNLFKNKLNPWVVMSVDSTELNRIWPMENFSELINLLYNSNLGKTFFIINNQNHQLYFKNILKNVYFKDNLIDCKKFNKSEIIKIISLADYFVGIDSGPSCISGAMNKKTFCIFGATDASLPMYESMIKIKSDIYDTSRELGIIRCGDNFAKNDLEVKTINTHKVFNIIKNSLKNDPK